MLGGEAHHPTSGVFGGGGGEDGHNAVSETVKRKDARQSRSHMRDALSEEAYSIGKLAGAQKMQHNGAGRQLIVKRSTEA